MNTKFADRLNLTQKSHNIEYRYGVMISSGVIQSPTGILRIAPLKTATIIENKNTETGFTLIELMVSLVLGLLISAAAVQIYIVNVKTSTIQQSSSDLQDASIFGIQYLESQIRMLNLGNTTSDITDTTIDGGIVLTGININNFSLDLSTGAMTSSYTNTGYLTRSAADTDKVGTNAWTGISNTNINSDQLTLQYENITGKDRFDCEGNTISTGDTVIERYFLRESSTAVSTGTIKNLVLACDAGRVNTSASPYAFTDFGGTGIELIQGVDQFKVLLGTTDSDNEMTYLPSRTYITMSTPHPPITSIKLGMIIHGSTPIIGSADLDKFDVFGIEHTLKTDTSRSRQMRTAYESTILLRNARVIILDNVSLLGSSP